MTRTRIAGCRLPITDCLKKLIAAVSVCVAGSAIVGCSTSDPTLTLKSPDNRQYVLPIGRGYFDQSEDGVIDVVLVSNPQTDSVGTLSATGSDLRHVMHVRLHWLPSRRVIGGADQTSNATIDWCVLPEPGRPSVVYTGAGSARFSVDGSTATLSLYDIPVSAQGTQRDQAALPRAVVAGEFAVLRSSTRVRELLEQASDARTAALRQSPPMNGPPARSPIGP